MVKTLQIGWEPGGRSNKKRGTTNNTFKNSVNKMSKLTRGSEEKLGLPRKSAMLGFSVQNRKDMFNMRKELGLSCLKVEKIWSG